MLIDYLKNQQKILPDGALVKRPLFIKRTEEVPYYDAVEELFWMILVCQYGDYKTSPRDGWLYKRNLDDIIYDLEQMVEANV